MKSLARFATAILASSFALNPAGAADLFEKARAAKDDLQFCVYATEDSTRTFASDEAARQQAVALMRQHGITKIFLETYRSNPIASDALTRARDFFLAEGFEVSGGIATLAGPNTGVVDNGKLGWLNYQNKKTRDDLAAIMTNTVPVFSEYIVDDFLCTSDTSDESAAAKGDRSWSEYRRALMAQVSRESLIAPAKAANPDIRLIIKYPQWYDRFHEFGYELAKQPGMFDAVWVGTETRGALTQRFGFVQQYQGFVNLRWITSIAGDKVLGAWFDHGDCDGDDFIEQAYQSVLAGAKQIMIFSYAAFPSGHPGHPKLIEHFDNLVALAKTVRQHPVQGIAGYKPVNSDAGGDLFIMDFIGMLGVPLVPVSEFPENAKAIFLPAQAAADPQLTEKVRKAHDAGKPIIMTASLLAAKPDDSYLREIAGIAAPVVSAPEKAGAVSVIGLTTTHGVGGASSSLQEAVFDCEHGLDIEGRIELGSAQPLLEARLDNGATPFLTVNLHKNAPVIVLNSHTFSQADYDAVGEVLLPPRALGIMSLPNAAVNRLRAPIVEAMSISFEAPVRVVVQPLGNGTYLVHNYRTEPAHVRLKPVTAAKSWTDRFQNTTPEQTNDTISLEVPARSRAWLAPAP